jgi:uncharacterized protein (TIGR03000 family)
MIRNCVAAIVLALAAVFAWPSDGMAQFRGGGMRWGGGWNSGAWNQGRGGFYVGYGNTYYSPYGYGYAYGYPRWYTGPNYSYSNYPPIVYSNNYGAGNYSYRSAYPPADSGDGTMARADDKRVNLAIRLPSPDAKLWIEGQEMNLTGVERPFISPPLEAGKDYTYSLRAQWNEGGKVMDQTRSVPVHAGDRITVDFTQPERKRATTSSGGLN